MEEWRKHHYETPLKEYYVSSIGRWKIINKKRGEVLKVSYGGGLNDDGYLSFGRLGYAHRAIAEVFIPNPDNKPTVDHINRNRHDNRVENLRWATFLEQNHNSSGGRKQPMRMFYNEITGEFIMETRKVAMSQCETLFGLNETQVYNLTKKLNRKRPKNGWFYLGVYNIL